MKKNFYVIIFFQLMLCLGLISSGCKHDKIKFYRESAAENIKKSFPNNKKSEVKINSSGVIILKDESYKNININFGPKDINFDLPSKF